MFICSSLFYVFVLFKIQKSFLFVFVFQIPFKMKIPKNIVSLLVFAHYIYGYHLLLPIFELIMIHFFISVLARNKSKDNMDFEDICESLIPSNVNLHSLKTIGINKPEFVGRRGSLWRQPWSEETDSETGFEDEPSCEEIEP